MKRMIAWSSLRKLLKKWEVEYIARDAVIELIDILTNHLKEITNLALEMNRHAGLERLRGEDIQAAISNHERLVRPLKRVLKPTQEFAFALGPIRRVMRAEGAMIVSKEALALAELDLEDKVIGNMGLMKKLAMNDKRKKITRRDVMLAYYMRGVP